MSNSCTMLTTDFAVGLHNNSITIPNIIKHIKKCGKSNGYKYFSFIVETKYLKHIKCPYKSKPIDIEKLKDEKFYEQYKTIYKNAVMVSPKFYT